jgi:predicted AAA+ superfamily ATPase
MIISRTLLGFAQEMLEKYPILTITGPRQSGKTTFAQQLRPAYQYVSLEDIDNRIFAQNDPKGFLETYQNGVIIDEVQNVPALFSYLQTYTDQRKRRGEYILTGSQQFLLLEKISQSLAGRVAIFSLLPFSYSELKNTQYKPQNWLEFIYQGAYPRLIIDSISPRFFYANYLQTYLERDVRQIINVHNLLLFQRFMQLLAGRTGQLLNQNNLSIEVGVDNKTISAWLSVLEASYIIYRLPPYYQNFSKRVIKSPKLYFYDTGLAAYLLGINNTKDLDIHFAKGALFENLVINELLKERYNRGERPQFYFWNDSQHHEIDLLFDENNERHAFEIKSGQTIQPHFFDGLNNFKKVAPDTNLNLVYGGNTPQSRTGVEVKTFDSL